MNRAELTIRNLVRHAGIQINGRNPWDIQVQDNRLYNRIITDGSLGLGESYMDGWWDVARLDEMIARILSAHLDRKVRKNPRLILFLLQRKVMNIANKKRAFKVGEQHYDLGNELYEAMLDPDLNYSCGYWKDAKTLHEAQTAKIDLICRKLQLKKGMKVLDIGSGWGNFAKYAAEKYGVSVVGITVSKEQATLATKRCKGLPVEFKIMDYRDLKETGFDRVVSIGMFEHVTYKNYDTFMKIAERTLNPGGLFLLHTIGSNESVIAGEPWQEKYIFPNSHLPSIAQIGKAAENKFVIEDIHNFGYYYYPTLMSWWKNFDTNWAKLKKINPEKYDERFYKMWKYYLLSCAGAFKSRTVQLYQVVLSKEPYPQIYQTVR
jgi:cyclopropane-fatty-acyl-phospholipid synthase